MKLWKEKKRILAFLLAMLIVVSGVLFVAADSVVEYSEQEVSMAELLAAEETGATVACYLWLDGQQKLIDTITGYYSVDSANRSYVTLDQLVAVYEEYGFTEEKAEDYLPSQKLFPHSGTAENTIWADALDDSANQKDGVCGSGWNWICRCCL